MRISELIRILNEHLKDVGDKEVFLLEDGETYPFTYLGYGCANFGSFFWLTAQPAIDEDVEPTPGHTLDDFKAPVYKPVLKIVK